MALIPCPECGKEISELATVCVHCGYPYKEQREKHLDFKNPRGVRCPKCGAESVYTVHHTSEEKPISFLCGRCGTKFE